MRRHGTLACYSRHRVSRDALADLGQRDLTAHVDFTALREAGEAEGLDTVAFTRQAPWLVAAGIFDDIAATGAPASAQARMLLDGEGMGEEIRVLVQAKGLSAKDLVDAQTRRFTARGCLDSLGSKDRMTGARGRAARGVSRLHD